MNSNLIVKELKRNRKNLLIWLSIVMGFTFLILAIFPYMEEMGDGMAQLMESIPAELGKAMGMDANTWSSILGFYSTYYAIYIVVMVSIFTTSTGATIISKEEKDGTSEFLLTRPLSRKSIVQSKLVALLILSLIIYAVQTITAMIGMSMFSTQDVNWDTFTEMHLSGLILILFFTCTGVLISMFVRPKKNFMGIVVGLTFGTYFISALSKSTDAVSWLGYISPFHYMEISISPEIQFNIIGAACLLLLGAVFLFVSSNVYSKKDIAG